MRNAFNSIRWDDVFEELARRGVPRYLRRLPFSYFRERKIAYWAEGAWRIRCVYTVVPQGSAIGPLIWDVVYDGVLRIELPPGCETLGFVDDIGMVATATTLEKLREIVAEATALVSGWLESRGQSFAIGKTEWAFVNNKRVPQGFALNLAGVQVAPLPTVKYLGVHFDRRRTFRPHIKAGSNKALKVASCLSRLMSNLRGPAMFVRRAYWAITESVVLYAAPI